MRYLEENETCPECGGVAVYVLPPNCSCHISPPCTACVENVPECEKCRCSEVEDK